MTRQRSLSRVGRRDRLPTPLPKRYEVVRQRRHVRCVVPPNIPVFVSLSAKTKARRSCRAVALDISVGGLCAEVIERHSLNVPVQGEDVSAVIELDGRRVEVTANVKSSSPRKVRLSFIEDSNGGGFNDALLLLLGDLLSRDLRQIDRGRSEALLHHHLGFVHLSGAEHLELFVKRAAGAGVSGWWRLAILDYVVSWSASDGLACRAVGKRESGEPLAVPALETLTEIARMVVERARVTVPQLAAELDLIAETARQVQV